MKAFSYPDPYCSSYPLISTWIICLCNVLNSFVLLIHSIGAAYAPLQGLALW